MAFVVLYDACVLYPAPLRDLLIRLANTGVVRARWSATILDECFRNILENRPDLKPESLERTRELMTQAVPDCMVTNFEGSSTRSFFPTSTIALCSPSIWTTSRSTASRPTTSKRSTLTTS